MMSSKQKDKCLSTVSQGSVATRLTSVGTFTDQLNTSLLKV